MKKIFLIIFTVFLLASCAMEDVSNNSSDSEIGVRAADVSARVDFTSNTSSDITFDRLIGQKLKQLTLQVFKDRV